MFNLKCGVFTSCSLSLALSCSTQLKAHPSIFIQMCAASLLMRGAFNDYHKGAFLHNSEFCSGSCSSINTSSLFTTRSKFHESYVQLLKLTFFKLIVCVCVYQKLNSSCQAWWEVSLSTKPPSQPHIPLLPSPLFPSPPFCFLTDIALPLTLSSSLNKASQETLPLSLGHLKQNFVLV